mgnify:FL=1
MRTSWMMVAAFAFFPGLCAVAPEPDTASHKLKQELFTGDARWAGLEVYVEIPFRHTASAVVFLKGPVRSVADRNEAFALVYQRGPGIIGVPIAAVLNDFMPVYPDTPPVPFGWGDNRPRPLALTWVAPWRHDGAFRDPKRMGNISTLNITRLESASERHTELMAQGPRSLADLVLDIEYTLFDYPFGPSDKLDHIMMLIKVKTGRVNRLPR